MILSQSCCHLKVLQRSWDILSTLFYDFKHLNTVHSTAPPKTPLTIFVPLPLLQQGTPGSLHQHGTLINAYL